MLLELRKVLRRLAARPGYSALSIGVLGLGLGAMLFLLGAVNGLILEPLPFPNADRLVAIGSERDDGFGIGGLHGADFLRLQRELRGVEALGMYGELTASLSPGAGAPPARYTGTTLSAGMLGLLGAAPVLGRGFDAGDDRPGAALAVLLSDRAWRSGFAADPAIVGRRIDANGEAATVIGVMPPGFAFPFVTDVWFPQRLGVGEKTEGHVVARLAPGVGLEQARAELESVTRRLGPQLVASAEHERLAIKPLSVRFIDEKTRQFVWIMFAAGVLVLLVACANAANLQMAHALGRGRELAVRSALGASRRRLAWEVLADSLLLSLAACVLGLALAHIGGKWLMAVLLANEDAPAYYVRLGFDARMAMFGVAATLLTTLLAGLFPALRASRTDVQRALRAGDRGSAGGFARVLRGLVVAEVAITVVLLVGAGTFIRALDAMADFDFGTAADPRQVLTGRVGLFGAEFADGAQQVRFFERVVERLRSDPDVIAASAATALPGTMAGSSEMVGAPGQPRPATGYPTVLAAHVDDHFAAVYGLRLRSGRFFDSRDLPSGRSAVIDARLAELLWPGRDAVGRTLLYNPQRDERGERIEVVGVVDAMHLEDVDDPVRPTLLLPLRQYPARFATVAVLARGNAQALAPRVAEAVRTVDADTPVYWQRTQQQAIEMGRVGPLLLTQVFAAVGLLALLLAAAGLYGVLALAVGQRTREIGIRRAVGAGGGSILVGVSSRLLWEVGLGMAVGIGLALPWSRLLEDPALGTRGHDLAVFCAVAAMVMVVAVLASALPLRRALQVDPIVALRQE